MTVTITRLRRNLFDLVDRASRGEPIVIVGNRTEVARLLPAEHLDWRGRMTITPRLQVADDEAFLPLDDWDAHV